MNTYKGSVLLAKALKAHSVDTFFYLIGGPMSQTAHACIAEGLRGIDVRDERAAAFAATAYSRITLKPGIVISASGPGTTNTVTGVSHAHTDCSPVVVLGGSAPMSQRDMGTFQETDQLSLMKPITKWAHQVQTADRIPDAIGRALQISLAGRPGPVYLDFPGNVLYTDATSGDLASSPAGLEATRTSGDPAMVKEAVQVLQKARKPIVITGSGILRSRASEELEGFLAANGLPLFTTPLGRGVVPEDHPLCLLAARSTAFREADCLLVIGTRVNYMLNYLGSPIFNADARLIQVDVDPQELGHNHRADVAIAGDAKMVLKQLTSEAKGKLRADQYAPWVEQLRELHQSAVDKHRQLRESNDVPIHPLRLCHELQELLPREAILVVDGHEILGFARQSIPSYMPGHRLNPGAYGTMGVGVPFGIGAAVAKPDHPVVVLTGDGAFGYHAMELDTATRHRLGIVVVISNNGGWTATRGKPGYSLGFTDYHRLADVFGTWGVKVEQPAGIRSALRQAVEFARAEKKPAIVNVITAPVPQPGRAFSRYDAV